MPDAETLEERVERYLRLAGSNADGWSAPTLLRELLDALREAREKSLAILTAAVASEKAAAEANSALNHEAYVSAKRAEERDLAERQCLAMAEVVEALRSALSRLDAVRGTKT